MIIDLTSFTFIGQGESATAEPRTVHAARSMSSTTGLFLAQGTIYYAELRSYIQQAKKDQTIEFPTPSAAEMGQSLAI